MGSTTTGTEHYVARQEGGRVYCYQVGRGEPLVFMSKGSGRSFRLVTDMFASHFTCYVLDAPGYDRSDIPRSWLATKRWSVPDYTEAVLEVLDIVGITQCSFVGDHTGSMIVLDIAANHPGRVKKLVLDCLPYWDQRKGEIVWEKFYKPQNSDTNSYDVPVIPLLLPWDEAKEKEPGLTLEEWKILDELNRRDRRWHRVHQEANAHFDTESLGPRVKAPTLLIYGEGDPTLRGAERANAAIENSIIKVLRGTPGSAHESQPKEFAKDAVDFLLDRH